MSDTWRLDEEAEHYLRRFPSTRTAAQVDPTWLQYRVEGGIIARACAHPGSDHAEDMKCWAFYPDPPPVH